LKGRIVIGATFFNTIKMETLVLIDELVCEHISLKEIEKELNKEIKFCSSRVLIEYMNNLISQEQ
jgi:hypothetical protein